MQQSSRGRVSDVFQSRFLKAIDLLDDETGEYRNVKVVIEDVQVEDLPGRDNKAQTQPVLYFRGKKKCLPLNKTNATLLQEQLGDTMDEWLGHTIGLYVTTTTFEGQQKQVIRITPKGTPRRAAAPAAAQPAPAAAAPARRTAAPVARDDFAGDTDADTEPARPAAAGKPGGFDPDEIPF